MTTTERDYTKQLLIWGLKRILKRSLDSEVLIDKGLVLVDDCIYSLEELSPKIISWAATCGYRVVIERDGIKCWRYGDSYIRLKPLSMWDDFAEIGRVNFIGFDKHPLSHILAALIVAIYRRTFNS